MSIIWISLFRKKQKRLKKKEKEKKHYIFENVLTIKALILFTHFRANIFCLDIYFKYFLTTACCSKKNQYKN